ncbi:hypothetical protein ASE21_14380 [Flavobacterium sp. Root901]|nr:hypothetical protein ASE21_14380 [Flavobacterium sp. Root901]
MVTFFKRKSKKNQINLISAVFRALKISEYHFLFFVQIIQFMKAIFSKMEKNLLFTNFTL